MLDDPFANYASPALRGLEVTRNKRADGPDRHAPQGTWRVPVSELATMTRSGPDLALIRKVRAENERRVQAHLLRCPRAARVS